MPERGLCCHVSYVDPPEDERDVRGLRDLYFVPHPVGGKGLHPFRERVSGGEENGIALVPADAALVETASREETEHAVPVPRACVLLQSAPMLVHTLLQFYDLPCD